MTRKKETPIRRENKNNTRTHPREQTKKDDIDDVTQFFTQPSSSWGQQKKKILIKKNSSRSFGSIFFALITRNCLKSAAS